MPWGVAAAAVVGAVSSNVASNKASGDIKRSTDKSIAATEQATEQARADVNRLFPEARQFADQGFQGALDVFGQSLPSQVDVFQQGNIGAQQQILAGLPQIQNAILGGNIDLSALQPTNIQTDLGFFNQQLPVLAQPQIDNSNVSNFNGQLAGLRNPMNEFGIFSSRGRGRGGNLTPQSLNVQIRD